MTREKRVAKNKPDLSRRPAWARYWAQHEDGCCLWFELMPMCIEADRGQGVWYADNGRYQSAGKMPIDAMGWAYSLLLIHEDDSTEIVRVRDD